MKNCKAGAFLIFLLVHSPFCTSADLPFDSFLKDYGVTADQPIASVDAKAPENERLQREQKPSLFPMAGEEPRFSFGFDGPSYQVTGNPAIDRANVREYGDCLRVTKGNQVVCRQVPEGQISH